MPNWVKNIVHALDEDANFEEFTNDEGNFTFEKIVPMPSNIYRGAFGQQEKQIYGENNWFDWSRKNWGTKWDACEPEVNGRTVVFNTAWSCPEPVLIALAKKVGGVLVFYADEDIGNNFGAFFVTKKGEVVDVPSNYVLASIIHYDLDLRYAEVIDEFRWILEDAVGDEGDE